MAKYRNLLETFVAAFVEPQGIARKDTELTAKLTQEITLTGSKIALHLSTGVEVQPDKYLFYEGTFDRDYTTKEELEEEVKAGIEALNRRGYKSIDYVIKSFKSPEHN